MRIVTVDPGLSGAYALVDTSDLTSATVADFPLIGERKKSIINGVVLAAALTNPRCVDYAIIEKVHSMPREGVSSAFRFGTAYGQVLGVVQTLEVPYTLVTPAKWKRAMGLSSDKENSRRRATERFPHLAQSLTRKKDHNRAEALMLALWYIENSK